MKRQVQRGRKRPVEHSLPVAEHLALEIVVHRLLPEPYREESVPEVLPRNGDLLPTSCLHHRAAPWEIRDDDLLAALQIGDGLQEPIEPLPQPGHVGAAVLLEAL